jgi:hypothetical protein
VLAACAATIRTHTQQNPDLSQDTAYPADGKQPGSATFTWACDASLAIIANQNTGTATSINVDSCASGTGVATAVFSFVQTDGSTPCSAAWSITGTNPNRLLVNAGGTAGSGNCRLRAAVVGVSAPAFSAVYPWSYTTVSSDTTAPNPVTGNVCLPASASTITCTFDSTVDPADAVQSTGVKTYHFYRNGSLLTGQDLTAVSSGMQNDFTPTAIGTASATAVQTGASWALSGNGGLGTEGAADGINSIAIALNGATFDITARVSAIQAAATDNKAVLEFRGSTSSDAIADNCTLDLSGGVLYSGSRNRKTTGGSRGSDGQAATQIFASMPPVVYLHAHYDSSGLDCDYSLDGGAWVSMVANYSLAPLLTAKTAIAGATATSNGTSINVTFDWVSVNNVGRLSKTLTVPTGSATYTVKAEDNAGNLSTALTGSTTAPAATGSPIKFQPGWYGLYNTTCARGVAACTSSALVSTVQTEICANSDLVGMELVGSPGFLIPDTANVGNYTGDSSQGFTVIDAVVNALNSCNKFLILQAQYGWFGNFGAVSSYMPSFTYPASGCSLYNCTGGTGTSTDYGVVNNNQPSQTGFMAKIWQSDWRALAVAAVTAYCNRYDSSAAFYALGVLYDNTSLPLVSPFPTGYTEAGFNTQYDAYLDGARSACASTNIQARLDYADPNPAQTSTHLAKLLSMHGVVANNDLWISYAGGATNGQKVYTGAAGSPSVIDYRGVVRYFEQVESPDMCGARQQATPAQIFDVMQNGNANNRARWPSHIVISMATECDPTYGWVAWKAFIASKIGQVMNGRDSTLRTPAIVKASYCESSMTCP